MAEKSRTFEVRMEGIEFVTKGAGGNRARTEHTLASTLHWPKPGTQAKTYARAVEMDGMARDFEKTISGGGRGGSSRTRRIAAKGDVVARLSLVFEPRA